MLTTQEIESNYSTYKKYLTNIIGKESYDKLINALGGENDVKYATYTNTSDSLLSYDGSAVQAMLDVASLASKINETIGTKKVEVKKIYKVVLLSQISKAIMYTVNDNTWEIENRGILYKFKELDGAIRSGERSALIALSCGIELTPIEFEAIKSYSTYDNDTYVKSRGSLLTTIIKSAFDIYNNINRR